MEIKQLKKDLQELNELINNKSNVSYRLEKNGDIVATLSDTEHNFANIEHLIDYTFNRNEGYIKLELDYREVEEANMNYFDWYLDKNGFHV